VTALYRNK